MNVIKAVIFGWGGVLIDNPTPALVAYCSATLGVSAERFAEARETHYPPFSEGRSRRENSGKGCAVTCRWPLRPFHRCGGRRSAGRMFPDRRCSTWSPS